MAANGAKESLSSLSVLLIGLVSLICEGCGVAGEISKRSES